MRVGYTCHDSFPSTSTNTQQIFWTLFEMAQLGHAVDLCVPSLSGGLDARRVVARHYGVPDERLPDAFTLHGLERQAASSTLARGRFDLRAPGRFSSASHDLIWTRDPVALVSAVHRGLPVVFETYRPDFAAAPAFAFWRRLTLRLSAFAGVIVHSRLAGDAFLEAGVAASRVLVAHNGFAPSLMEPRLSRDAARKAIGWPADRWTAVYAGHVGAQKGTDALVSLAAAVPEATVVIVGADERSDERRQLEAEARRVGALNVVILPRVGLRDVAQYLYAADCLLVPPTDAPLARYGRTVMPMKLFPYMAAGRPIVAPRLPDIEELLQDGRTAVLVPPDDTRAAADAVRSLAAEPERAARLSAAALDESAAFTWAARASTISTRLERWLTPGSHAT